MYADFVGYEQRFHAKISTTAAAALVKKSEMPAVYGIPGMVYISFYSSPRDHAPDCCNEPMTTREGIDNNYYYYYY